ncbi:(3R)-hydroxyacyl-ACP dehydratase subunit HadB [Tomitella biformata]|uniref:(3R)-hydroxyacyl-ACP dehydratase subunit HadB n=1 Tax=Tomitella biformata TaxID=630403 RepID=UPI00046745B7|nr:(3R)-hydroxyacyl-ACP dehydratase subunit HadB [Tomitella biformata]
MTRRAFDSVSVGDLLPAAIVPLERFELIRYAGVSGDLNPIHWDDSIAHQIGLDGAVAHGMLTMGIGGGFINEWVDDPSAMLEINVRFTSPVYVPAQLDGPAEIEFEGRVKSLDAEAKTAVIAIVARSQGKKIFGRATATVQLA